MKKRTAVGVAATATLLSGTAVVALAANGILPILGFGGGTTIQRASSASPEPTPSTVVVTRYVDDYITVPGTEADAAASDEPLAAAPVALPVGATGTNVIGWLGGTGPALAGDNSTTAPAPPPAPGGTPSGADPAPRAAPAPPSSPTTAAPTTAAPTTAPTTAPPSAPTTTWPPGTEISRSWHGPIPPLPPGCVKPHLEDNGVWNCEH